MLCNLVISTLDFRSLELLVSKYPRRTFASLSREPLWETEEQGKIILNFPTILLLVSQIKLSA